MNRSIRAAIDERRLIELNYEPGYRLIEPHAYGLSKDGNELLRAYQTEGASASGEHQNWKLFRVDRITDLKVLDERFDDPRPGYRQGDSAMKGGFWLSFEPAAVTFSRLVGGSIVDGAI